MFPTKNIFIFRKEPDDRLAWFIDKIACMNFNVSFSAMVNWVTDKYQNPRSGALILDYLGGFNIIILPQQSEEWIQCEKHVFPSLLVLKIESNHAENKCEHPPRAEKRLGRTPVHDVQLTLILAHRNLLQTADLQSHSYSVLRSLCL